MLTRDKNHSVLMVLSADFNPRRRVDGNRVIYRGVLSAHDNAVLQCVAANDHGSILANAALKVIGLSVSVSDRIHRCNLWGTGVKPGFHLLS